MRVGENVDLGELGMAEKPRHPVLAGWIAGSLEIVVTYPLEFVKTQLQLQVTCSPPNDYSRPATDLLLPTEH